MRIVVVLSLLSAGLAMGQCPNTSKAGACSGPPAAVFQAPPQRIQVIQSAPQVEFIQAAPAPQTVWVSAPRAYFSASSWVAAPAVFTVPVATSPRLDVRTGPFGRVRRVIVN
jgi:hypothetical protein